MSDKARILVVEDSATQAAKVEIILESEGFEVDVARDGERGVAMFGDAAYDLVLTDIVMPGMTGYELCRRIKSEPRGASVPVILLSSLSDPKDLLEGLDCGADNFIPKPFDPDYLVERVRSVLANRQVRENSTGEEGIDLVLQGRRVTINSNREQIVDLLVSSFETLVRSRESEKAARAAAEAAERRAAFLAEAGAILSSSLDLDGTLERTARLALTVLGRACVIVVDEPSLPGLALAVASDSDGEQALREALFGEGSQDAVDVDAIERTARSLGMDECLVATLEVRGRQTGAIAFAAGERGFSAGDRGLVTSLATRIATAVDNARLFEAAQRANREKDEFLAVVSHELRTPLSAMVGWTHLIRTGKLDDAMLRRALDTIDRNAALQKQLVDDLVDISRITGGKFELSYVEVDLDKIVREAVDANRPLADDKGIVVEIAGEAGPVRLRADENRLHQVFSNLLTNAIKFTPAGGRIQVGVGSEGDEGVVTVSDSGIGIEPEFLPYVFERFKQASTTERQKGLGLGLAIVRTIVSMHGGSVEASSEGRGRGATFTVRLPFEASRAAGS
jgi:signal transduction histidine kinase